MTITITEKTLSSWTDFAIIDRDYYSKATTDKNKLEFQFLP